MHFSISVNLIKLGAYIGGGYVVSKGIVIAKEKYVEWKKNKEQAASAEEVMDEMRKKATDAEEVNE